MNNILTILLYIKLFSIGIMFNHLENEVKWFNSGYISDYYYHQKDEFVLNDTISGYLDEGELHNLFILQDSVYLTNRILITDHGGEFVSYKKDSVIHKYKGIEFKYENKDWGLLINYLK